MKVKKFLGRFLRHPKTTQEKRANGKRSKWARAKRNSHNLPDAYDDIWVRRERSWKETRKTQYRGRGKRHELIIPYYRYYNSGGLWYPRLLDEYIFERYLKDHNIPYRMEEIKVSYEYYNRYFGKNMYRVETTGYRFIWWYDKDIGVDYII